MTLKLLLDNKIWRKSLIAPYQEDQNEIITTTETFNSSWKRVKVECSYNQSLPNNPKMISKKTNKKVKKKRRNLLGSNRYSVKNHT